MAVPSSARSTSRNTPIGRGLVRRVAEPREREGDAGSARRLVVHEERVLADLGHVDELDAAVGSLHDPALEVRAEADRLAVGEVDEHVGAPVPCW